MGTKREAGQYFGNRVLENRPVETRVSRSFFDSAWSMDRARYDAPLDVMRKQLEKLRSDAEWLEGLIDEKSQRQAALDAEYGPSVSPPRS